MKSRSPSIEEGQLDSERVAHLLEAAEAGRLTAHLWFETEAGMGQVDFFRGYVVGASIGPVSGRAALTRLLSLSDGRYRVVREDVPEGPALVPDVCWLLEERARRQTQWRWLCEQAPPMSSVLAFTQDGRKARGSLHGTDRLVLPLADGRRTLADVLTESNIDPVDALASVVSALETGLLCETEQRRSLFPLCLKEHVPHSLPSPPRLASFGEGPPSSTEEDTPRTSEVRPFGTGVSSGTQGPPEKRSPVPTLSAISVGEDRGANLRGKTRREQDGTVTTPVPEGVPPSSHRDSLQVLPASNRYDTPPPDVSARRYVGLYEMLLRIGGDTSSVYVCRMTVERGFGRVLALKLVNSRAEPDHEATEAFLARARLASRLNHPNLVRVLATGLHAARAYVVMDYLEGASLERLLTLATQETTVRRVLATIVDALCGLHAMHELTDDDGSSLELVHGDVSPESLLVGVDGRCRLMGLGTPQRARTDWNSPSGRRGFLAPEQLLNRPVDRRTDVFAMGATLWSALTGQRLFSGRSAEDTARQICHDVIAPPSQVGLGSPAALDEVCLTALQRDPDKRFPTAEHMAVALRETTVDLAPADDVASWVRVAVGRELAQRRLLILDSSRVVVSPSSGPKASWEAEENEPLT